MREKRGLSLFSPYFEYFEFHCRGAARAGRDADDAVQPLVALGAGLEARRGAHVVERRIDRLPLGQFAHHLRRAMTVAEIAHIDERVVARLERVARIELGHAVRANELPVGATRKDAAGKVLAPEAAAGDRNDAAAAERRLAELLRRRERDLSPQ